MSLLKPLKEFKITIYIYTKNMTDSSCDMTHQEKIVQERVNQSRKFLKSNDFNQSLRAFWSELKEDSKYDLL